MATAETGGTSRAPATARAWTPLQVQRALLAVAIVLAPLLLIPATILEPAQGGIGDGARAVALNAAADPAANQFHLVLFVALSFLLPVSALGLAWLAFDRSPWLALVGGGLGLVGWIPWAALTAQDDMTYQMARLGGGSSFVALWNRFTTDTTMLTFLLVYVVCHLLAYVVLAVALGRPRVIPRWAAWALGLTTPLTIASFPTHQYAILVVVGLLWLAGSVPAALALWRAGDAAVRGRSPSCWAVG